VTGRSATAASTAPVEAPVGTPVSFAYVGGGAAPYRRVTRP
jgi:hypothetical protein